MKYTGIYIIMLMNLAAFGQETFTNPILPSGADPWVTWKDGYYYYTNTVGNRIILYKTEKLHELKKTHLKQFGHHRPRAPIQKQSGHPSCITWMVNGIYTIPPPM
jgi:GH43 family beta-xylosidase